MPKKGKKEKSVRELHSKVKLIKEIPRESELEEDISQAEEQEFEDFISNPNMPFFPVLNTGQETSDDSPRISVPQQVQRNEPETTRLYDIGRGLGSQERRRYSVSSSVPDTGTLPERGLRTNSLPSQTDSFGEQNFGEKLKTESEERQKKYSGTEMGSPSAGKRKRYEWEV